MSENLTKVYTWVGTMMIEHPLGYALGCIIIGFAMNVANFWMLAKLFGLL